MDRQLLFSLIPIAIFVSGCATTSATVADPDLTNGSYSNFLVIGVAGDYTSRAQFEREVVSDLRGKGASASAYYSIVEGNKPINADDIRAAVQSGNFDSVLVTRVLDTQQELKVNEQRAETGATPIGGQLVNLFRYDYTDYESPASIDLKTSVTLASELYNVETEEIVWTMEQTSKDEINVGVLIDKAATAFVERLDRDDLISQ